MGQQGFLINTEDCIGCKACELACKDLHSFDIGPRDASRIRGLRRRLVCGRRHGRLRAVQCVCLCGDFLMWPL